MGRVTEQRLWLREPAAWIGSAILRVRRNFSEMRTAGEVCCSETALAAGNYAGGTLHYNYAVPKRQCMQRAEWRLVPGRSAVHLSEHYKLDCDYGTAMMALYKTGDGSDAIYLCANHIGEVQPRAANQNLGDVRLIEAEGNAGSTGGNGARGARAVALATAEVEIPKPVTPVAALPLRSVSNIKAAKVMERPVRAPARDLTYGSAAKALVDEAIWNMATGDFELYRTAVGQGRSVIEAALAAGGQLGVVHRKISEYTIKLESILFESKARISREDALDRPFEQATQEVIASDGMSDTEKDAAIAQIGALQESINKGLECEITPLQAFRVACLIAERVNWGTSANVDEALKPVYRAIYGSARSALRKSAPHAQTLEERLTNLYAARADLDDAIAAKDSQRLTA